MFLLELSIHHLFGVVHRSEAGIDNNEAAAHGTMAVKQWSDSDEAVEGGGTATLHRGVKESGG